MRRAGKRSSGHRLDQARPARWQIDDSVVEAPRRSPPTTLKLSQPDLMLLWQLGELNAGYS
jgi:hypothetical protein